MSGDLRESWVFQSLVPSFDKIGKARIRRASLTSWESLTSSDKHVPQLEEWATHERPRVLIALNESLRRRSLSSLSNARYLLDAEATNLYDDRTDKTGGLNSHRFDHLSAEKRRASSGGERRPKRGSEQSTRLVTSSCTSSTSASSSASSSEREEDRRENLRTEKKLNAKTRQLD